MRFASFKIVEAAERKIYAIGDSHADSGGISSYKGIINRANGGQPSTSKTNFGGIHTKRGTPVGLDTIPPNQIVIISQGANDTANSMRAFIDSKGKTKLVPPSTIAGNVAKVVNAAKANGHIVVFVLFPNGPGRGSGLAKYYGGDYQEEVRSAIKSAVSAPIVDLDGKGLAPDGIHSTSSAYRSVAEEAISIARSQAQSSPVKKVSNTRTSEPRPAAAASDDSNNKREPSRPVTQRPDSSTSELKPEAPDSPELSDLLSGMLRNWLSGGKTPALSIPALAALGLSPDSIKSVLNPSLVSRGDDSGSVGTRRPSAGNIYGNAGNRPEGNKPTDSRPTDSRPASNKSSNRNLDRSSKVTRNIVSPDDIKSYILSKGLSKNHAIGMIVNIRAESGFNSAAVNPNDKGMPAIGLFQHRATREKALQKAVPDWRTNWKGQIDFALSEPEGVKYANLRFRSPEAAARWFTINFERPENMVAVADARAKQAAQYA